MKIFFSSFQSTYSQALIEKNVKNVLLTFYDNSIEKTEKIFSKNNLSKLDYKMDIIIDSGAFTIWNTGGKINIDKYIKYCLDFEKKFENLFQNIYFINLDFIPGAPGQIPDHKEREHSAELSYNNFLYIKKQGVKNVLPVVHQHESPHWVKEYEKYTDFICISPANDQPNIGRMKWLDQIYSIIKPTTKTHGLAVTGFPLMMNYPWYSVDSSSWLNPKRFGYILYLDFLKCEKSIRPSIIHELEELHKYPLKVVQLSLKVLKYNSSYYPVLYYVDYFLDVEHTLTKLWVKRGIKWN